MSTEVVLAEATFNRRVRSYWLLSGTIVLIVTVFGIVLLPFWLILGRWVTERYLQHMSCILTDRSVKVSKGILVRQEKTVPLDKITDVALVEGPIMRYLDLQAIKIETAGSSAGAFLQIVGIQGTRDFRDAVLAQRDRVSDRKSGSDSQESPTSQHELLEQIRDTLHRIEAKLPES